MVVCPHGSAANNPALGAVQMSGAYLNTILPGGLQWFDSYLWLIPPFTLDIPTFCGQDPPALPTLDATDILSIMTGGRLGSAILGLTKAVQLMQVYAWYNLCHCLVDATPAPPGGQVAPVGLPILNPPGVDPNVIPCSTQLSAQQAVPASTFVNQVNTKLPLGALTIALTQKNIVNGATPAPMQWAYAFFDTTGNSLVGVPLLPGVASGVTRTDTISVPTNADRFNASVNCGAVTQTNLAQTQMDVSCNASPPVPVQPPDPQTNGLLQQILNLVTLLQRQLVPFAYISSTAHAGLTGAGTIAIQGLLGIRIDLTTIPATTPQDGSSPPFVFNAGWVSMEDANGFIDETRAHAQHQVWFSRIASDATLIGYSFAPGVVATITELHREP